ncbi:AraC family transcriptional regulator [Enterococcus sp. BWT-B8]|nr:AraC family transcriptional regulator [Enterococcus sp. BWT-B8]
MQQLAYLLFTYYYSIHIEYSINYVLQLLVYDTIRANSKTLLVNQTFISLVVFITKNIHFSLTIEDLCQFLHVSSSALTRLCKKNSGLSPKKLYRKIQCYEAKRLLLNTDMTIQEVSKELGFKNSFHFSKIFKLIENISPADFRREAIESSR